ncbi:MAG: UPF0280 family protein [Victivallales bacterium]|nr:UPF0280 family protein [Victivallales bacterium]MBR5837737.1 UPF0280 family protein [Victivallales bacterium]
MKNRRTFHKFTYKDSNFRLCCRDVLRMTDEIIRQRTILEEYIVRQPEFKTSLVPLRPLQDAPEIARRMCRAAMDVGVGPMAAVAGAIAQCAAEAAVNEGDEDVIVENGGDIFMVVSNPLSIGIHAGPQSPFNGLAFRVEPDDTPLAICSSSSMMGHSMSMGACDLATVVAKDAALADAAATLAANLVATPDDLEPTAARILAVPGVFGVLLVKSDKMAIQGTLPELVRNTDSDTLLKITRDVNSQQL